MRSTFVLAILCCIVASVARAQQALTNAFTYQGIITTNGVPADTTVDLTFTLWSHPTSTNLADRVGGPVALSGVTLDRGRFSVVLNAANEFGANAFNADARWIEVGVGGVVQSPRTQVFASPYALRALSATTAGSATTAANATNATNAINATNLALPFSGTASSALGILNITNSSSANGATAIVGTAGAGGVGVAGNVTGLGSVALSANADGQGARGLVATANGLFANAVYATASGNLSRAIFARGPSSLVLGKLQLGDPLNYADSSFIEIQNKNTDSLVLTSNTMIANEYVQISFRDPDGGTPPMSLRYTDIGSPARIDVIGGQFRGVLVNTSSRRFKHDISPVGSALNDLLKLRPVAFSWNHDHGSFRDVGLIAEDVAPIFPDVVDARGGQIDGIRYSGVTALLVRGMQEQQEQIEAQRRENAELRARLEKLERLVLEKDQQR